MNNLGERVPADVPVAKINLSFHQQSFRCDTIVEPLEPGDDFGMLHRDVVLFAGVGLQIEQLHRLRGVTGAQARIVGRLMLFIRSEDRHAIRGCITTIRRRPTVAQALVA